MSKLLQENPKATDPIYIKIQKPLSGLSPNNKAEKHVEELYQLSRHCLDSNFAVEIMHQFRPRYAEMYFASAIIERFLEKVSHEGNAGPDFYLNKLDGWAEVVTPNDGAKENPSSIPGFKDKIVSERPSDQIILRLAQAFTDKSKKLKSYIDRGLISSNQPGIICISGGAFSENLVIYKVGDFPEIVKTLLPIGNRQFRFNLTSNDIEDIGFQYRDSISKKARKKELDIDVGFFLQKEHEHISAVIFSSARPDYPIERPKWGSDFHTIHNPLAVCPLPQGYINCGLEYLVEFDQTHCCIETVEHEK